MTVEECSKAPRFRPCEGQYQALKVLYNSYYRAEWAARAMRDGILTEEEAGTLCDYLMWRDRDEE